MGAGEIADPEECAKITALGIDFLAAGIGNIHGVYPANWKGLDFELWTASTRPPIIFLWFCTAAPASPTR